MENKTEKLSQFFEQVKSLTFWKRIFGWSQFRNLSYDAYREFKSVLSQVSNVTQESSKLKSDNLVLKNDNEHLKNKQHELEKELLIINDRATSLSNENITLVRENIIFKQTEIDRKTKYEGYVEALNLIRGQIQDDRKKEVDQQQEKEIKKLKSQKEMWAKHQEGVKEVIKVICQKHTIEYVEKVPFKGNPDNTIKICDQFVIFDAKSPGSDDLGNFSSYIKLQTESVKKYIKEENVKKDIFLVIPPNTLDVIEQFSFNMGDYNAYVVTVDALEPIILSLKKLEEYQFVEQLSPEERDDICRVIGKFTHMTKRRIQVDQFFGRQFLDILSKCEYLPDDILKQAIEFEQSEKLNPPQEKREKLISNKQLEVDYQKIEKEAGLKGISS
jgi:hypothetical protein